LRGVAVGEVSSLSMGDAVGGWAEAGTTVAMEIADIADFA